MKKMNRKRLNNKGFTLIELLAVVVILAIVMGITGTAVLRSINSSRKSTLYSAAQNAANTLNTWVSEDMLVVQDKDKKLGDAFITDTQASGNRDNWICLKDLKIRNADGQTGTPTVSLASALSLSANDVDLTATVDPNAAAGGTGAVTVGTTCSAVRYNSSTGGYELLLVATTTGKYYVSSDATNNYAFSRAEGPGVAITD